MDIYKELDDLRNSLNRMIEDNALIDNPVLQVSRKLDEVIISFYKKEFNRYDKARKVNLD